MAKENQQHEREGPRATKPPTPEEKEGSQETEENVNRKILISILREISDKILCIKQTGHHKKEVHRTKNGKCSETENIIALTKIP